MLLLVLTLDHKHMGHIRGKTRRVNWHERVRTAAASRYFFWGVLGLFVVEATWFAFTYRHPMLFDESYHSGLIKLYAQQWSPFINNQTVSADIYGDVMHYPSFLYHYLMSFPYRLISQFASSEMVQVVSLRLINVAMVATGLWVFRKVLLQLKLSPGLSNLVILLFSLLPIVPMLAGQISYDNLLFLLTAASLYYALRLVNARQVDFLALTLWLSVSLAASMVKYTFLPVFAAEAGFLVIYLLRVHGRALLIELAASFVTTKRWVQVAALAGLVLMGGLYGARYGTNMVRYHTATPDCGQVLSVSRCMAYGPWGRNEILAKQATKTGVLSSPIHFSANWLKVMYDDFFRVAMNRFPDNQAEYSTILPIVRLAATLVVLIGAVTVVYRWRDLHSSPAMYLVLTIAITYVSVLWLHNYQDFLHTGEWVGTQGRYLLPLVLPVVAVFAFTLSKSLHDKKLLKVNLAILAVPLFLQGGGVFAGIVSSNPSWYWQNSVVIQQNEHLQKLIRPFVATKL